MDIKGFQIDRLPELKSPILIAGFNGWGNAMDVSTEAVHFFINECKARSFAKLDPDQFYRCDASRPVVNIEAGIMKHFIPPGGTFYAAATPPRSNDLILFRADEPSLNWNLFVTGLMSLSKSMQVCTIIALGSMFDKVLPSDRIISAICLVEIDTSDIDGRWERMDVQIRQLVENNPELQKMISDIRKAKARGSWSNVEKLGADRNVIDIRDFLDT